MRCVSAIPLLVVFIAASSASGQSLTNFLHTQQAKVSSSTSASDPLQRTTPRSSIYNLLESCHAGNFDLATQYLDLRGYDLERRTSEGPALARTLCNVLDRDSRFEVDQLSDNAAGDLRDDPRQDIEHLVSVQLGSRTVTLDLQRVTQGPIQVWLVSSSSVALIPELSDLLSSSRFESKLPRALVGITFIGTPVWIWLCLLFVALLLSVISRLLSKLFIALITPLAKRYTKQLQSYRLQAFTEPLRLLLSIAVFRACMDVIAPSALARDYLLKLLTLLFVLGTASLLMRVVDVASDQVISRLDPRERSLSYSVVPLIVRIVKICIFCIAVLFTFSAWGYNTNALLAGVGVGGLAIALAAQRTIENLFGGVSVISDRPVLVGDVCQFGGQVGTVEDIGLRSTRIRTLDRTVVTVPNSQFSTMTLENYSKRDRMWFHPNLHLRRDSEVDQIREFMNALRSLLENDARVDASGVPVRFTKITNESFEIDLFAYVLTADYNEFLQIQSELLLRIMEIARDLKIGFAVPFQESVSGPAENRATNDPSLDANDVFRSR
jgi:MscS family membrane protein